MVVAPGQSRAGFGRPSTAFTERFAPDLASPAGNIWGPKLGN
jgi:hypothetical protein